MQKRNTHVKIEYAPENPVKHVAVLMGGPSSEREVSISSAKGVFEELKKLNYKVTSVDFGSDVAEKLAEIKPDIVFNALHGTYGEDGTIPGMLNLLQIPYTHAGRLSSALAFDKLITRQIATYEGVAMPEMCIINKGELKEPFARPFVVKPIAEGSSVGVEIFHENDGRKLSDYNWREDDKVIVEKYIPGIDVQVAVVAEKAIGAMEIEPESGFYDYEAKYTDGLATHYIPPRIAEEVLKKLLDTTEKMHKTLGLRTISRADFRVNPEEGIDGVYFLEINSHPGFTPLSILPEIAASNNISFADLVEILLNDAKWEK